MSPALTAASLVAHRPELLRHCYRMLGSFADAEEVVQEALAHAWKARESYSGAAPLRHWLFRIATNACLNARRADKGRRSAHRATAAKSGAEPIGAPLDADAWITAAPDEALFGATEGDAASILEEREKIALAFIGLLHNLPARQRAVLLLKDVVDLSVDEIAAALDMSSAAVTSALHRARVSMPAALPSRGPEPPAEIVREYVRCWECRDLEGLLALLRNDVILTMPPWAIWFQGRAVLGEFMQGERFAAFWASGLRVVPTRANGRVALLFYRDAGTTPHSLQILGFDGSAFTELYTFVGGQFLHGFEESAR